MIFYGNGVVWDSRTNSRLCRFVDGKCEVTDTNEIAYLVRAGYKHDAIDYGDVVLEEKPVQEKTDEGIAQPKKRGRKTNASNQHVE